MKGDNICGYCFKTRIGFESRIICENGRHTVYLCVFLPDVEQFDTQAT